MLRYTTRPLSERAWVRPDLRRNSPFSVNWSTALDILEKEIEWLGGADLVIEVDVPESAIRNDGMLRAAARANSDAVRLALDSEAGPLLFACDRYTRAGNWQKMDGWQANVYAIAKTMEALRAVDRWGAASANEQYAGYRQIAATPITMLGTPAQARRWLDSLFDDHGIPADSRVRMAADRGRIALARRLTHPDTGGNAAEWHLVQEAATLLEVP